MLDKLCACSVINDNKISAKAECKLTLMECTQEEDYFYKFNNESS